LSVIVYWDANAFLGLINAEPDKLPAAQDVWDASEKGLVTIITSALTVAEVIHAKSAGKVDPSKRQLVNDFFRRPNLVVEPLTRQMAEMARDVVWDYGIKPKDACHVATAAFHKISEFHTFDDPLISNGAVTIKGFTVTAQKPSLNQPDLPNVNSNTGQTTNENENRNEQAVAKTQKVKGRGTRSNVDGPGSGKDDASSSSPKAKSKKQK
jgi:predicted nucleic acid-binding protein